MRDNPYRTFDYARGYARGHVRPCWAHSGLDGATGDPGSSGRVGPAVGKMARLAVLEVLEVWAGRGSPRIGIMMVMGCGSGG